MKSVALFVLATGMIYAGIAHFIRTDSYVAIMPDFLPYPRELVYISGAFEVLGGAGLLFRRWRRVAAWGLVILLIAVFPANVHMAVNDISPGDQKIPSWLLWLRLPLQLVLIAWAYWFTRPEGRVSDSRGYRS